MSDASLQSRVKILDNARHHGGERGHPSMILWHTARGTGDAMSVIEYLNTTDERIGSYHYVIDRPGPIYRMCPVELCAYHAGDSAWPRPLRGDGTEECRPNGGKSVNAISLGFCFANADGEEITFEQHASALWLAKVYMSRYDIPPSLNLGHCEVSPGRKIDPECAGNFSMSAWRAQIGDLWAR
jgi:N-acetyl-anhydromuramyl-L-alanine amidase AmpD